MFPHGVRQKRGSGQTENLAAKVDAPHKSLRFVVLLKTERFTKIIVPMALHGLILVMCAAAVWVSNVLLNIATKPEVEARIPLPSIVHYFQKGSPYLAAIILPWLIVYLVALVRPGVRTRLNYLFSSSVIAVSFTFSLSILFGAAVMFLGPPLARRGNYLPSPANLTILEDKELTLMSIEPTRTLEPSGFPTFHGVKILGQIKVESPEQRQLLSEILHRGLKEYDGTKLSCFNPRHGLRGVYKGETHDLLICFECGSIQYYRPDGRITYLYIRSHPGLFNELLTEAGIPLSKPK